jgi:putative DNA primase/helicase
MHQKKNEENRIDNLLPAAAGGYAREMDWAIFPLAPLSKVPTNGSRGFKDATSDPQAIENLWEEFPKSNIGCATGFASGLLVIDVDNSRSFEEFCSGRDIPETARQITSPGRIQIFFKMPEDISIACSASKLAEGVDVRADGGYTILPPSIHPKTGMAYDWVDGFELPTVGLANAPEWLLKEIQSPQKVREVSSPLQANGEIPEGQRNDSLFRYGAALRTGGASCEEILSSIRDRNQARCKPPLEEAELSRIAESAARYDPVTTLTDMGNAERFVTQHGDSLKYCTSQRRWYIWDGQKWPPDRLKEVELLAKRVVRSIPAEAEGLANDDQRKAIRKWARQSESAERIRAMVRVAQSDLAVAPDAFDTHPWLLNVENGTLDLKTGKFLPHNRDHLITKMAGAAWHSDAGCPTFLAFLERVLGGDSELISFIQKVAGLSLIGQARERVLVVLYGRGANGKTVLLETLMSVLGDYALSTPAETFLSKKTSSIPNDVARLKGARLVTCRETDREQRFCSASIKAITGGDKIAARFLYGEFFEFRPVGTPWLATNHFPDADRDDDALWDRLRVVPFMVKIPLEEQDRGLREKLLGERDGILRWAAEGCAEYLQGGLTLPKIMAESMWKRRASEEDLEGFIEEECYVSEDHRYNVTALYKAYVAFCKSSQKPVLDKRMVGYALKANGFQKRRSGKTGTWEWWGLAPRDPGAQDQGGGTKG